MPSEDPRRLAYDRLIYDFVAPETTGRAPHEPPDSLYAFMPALYEKTSSGSCLATIVDALAYTNFANRHNVPQMAIIGAELIGKGIKILSKIIKDHRLVATDETLCSVYLMTVYEVLQLHRCSINYLQVSRTSPLSGNLIPSPLIRQAQMRYFNFEASRHSTTMSLPLNCTRSRTYRW